VAAGARAASEGDKGLVEEPVDRGVDCRAVVKAHRAENPHLAIEALRDLLTDESGQSSPPNLVRQRAFSGED
jgi:hypothetical protein